MEETYEFRVAAENKAAQQLQVLEMQSEHCKLSWLPPSDDGESDVIGYRIERRLVSDSCWLSPSKELCDVTKAEVTDLVDGNE